MSGFPPLDASKYESLPNSEEVSVRRSFRQAAKDVTSSLLEKYGGPTLKAVGIAGVVGGFAAIYMQGREAWNNGVNKGRPVQAVTDLAPVSIELILAAQGGKAAYQAWAAEASASVVARAGYARILTGSTLLAGVGIMVATDIGQSYLHNRGYDVDNGYIQTAGNETINVNNAGRYIFPGDTLPLVESSMLSGAHISKTATGPYQWEVKTEFSTSSDEGGEPVISTAPLDQKTAGTLFEKFKHFGVFYQSYPVIENGEIKRLNGSAVTDENRGTVAKGMYENPEKAFDLFREHLIEKTISYAHNIAKERHMKLNGTERALDETDALPPAIMQEAANLVLKDLEVAYNAAGYSYIAQGVGFLDQTYPGSTHRFTDPKNLEISMWSASQFIEKWEKENPSGKFDWANGNQARALTAHLEKDLSDPQVRTAFIKVCLVDPASVNPKTREAVSGDTAKPSKKEISEINRDVINQIVHSEFLADPNTQGFDNAKLNTLQEQLSRAGHLARQHNTGMMNVPTMRAIETSLKSELSPEDTESQHANLMQLAKTSYEDLRSDPADPKSFDVRVLSFQANAYLLGLYPGRIDGLGGPLTSEALARFEILKNSPPEPSDSLLNSVQSPALPLAVIPVPEGP